MTITLSHEMLRALGAGVSRLNDGDLKNRAEADAVVAGMENAGYALEGEKFISKKAIFVNGHMSPNGIWAADITDAEREYVIFQITLHPHTFRDSAGLDDMIDENRYMDLPEDALELMAGTLEDIRIKKGLRRVPHDFFPRVPLDFVNNRGE